VICNGKFIMRSRVVPGEKEILADSRKAYEQFASRF
jgi:hypothetical protein